MVLSILFHWSGAPVHSQLVFCRHFCVWRCIPNPWKRIHGEKCTLCPPTPLPSCSSLYWDFNQSSVKIHNFGQNHIYCDKSSISFITKFMYRELHCLIFLVVLCQTLSDSPLSLGFSRHEYWSELPCPSGGDLPNLETEPGCHVSCIGRWVFCCCCF